MLYFLLLACVTGDAARSESESECHLMNIFQPGAALDGDWAGSAVSSFYSDASDSSQIISPAHLSHLLRPISGGGALSCRH